MKVRPEDWGVLGLEPGTEIPRVRQAYHHRRALYEPTALATYNLLDDDERADIVQRIDEAYRRIVGAEPSAAASPSPVRLPPPESEVPSGPAPDSAAEPGAYLQHHRLSQGLSLHQIAGETKIGVAILEQIENEDFDALPATVFVRGHAQQFARELKLPNAHEFAKLYIEKMVRERKAEE
jgi:hypothetical protein